jgi:glycosyltransferase involved in cell wall biosynthesis
MYAVAGDQLQFVTPSQWLREQALKSGAPTIEQRDCIAVIPNPIDTDYFRPAEQDSVGMKAKPFTVDMQGASEESFVLMFAAANLGNVAKGFAEFRLICNSLYDMGYTQLHALVVGENRLGDLGLKCSFTELGFIADAQRMRDAYWQADVYVTTSHEENLPTTIMESLSCGVPVAAFAVGGIPEMIESEGVANTGWLAPKMDTQTLIDGIADYFNSLTEVRSEMSSRCRLSAIEKYAAAGVAQRYLAVYGI